VELSAGSAGSFGWKPWKRGGSARWHARIANDGRPRNLRGKRADTVPVSQSAATPAVPGGGQADGPVAGGTRVGFAGSSGSGWSRRDQLDCLGSFPVNRAIDGQPRRHREGGSITGSGGCLRGRRRRKSCRGGAGDVGGAWPRHRQLDWGGQGYRLPDERRTMPQVGHPRSKPVGARWPGVTYARPVQIRGRGLHHSA